MGEEKPDEELMGKRKSSPRLSYGTLRVPYLHDVRPQGIIYTGAKQIFGASYPFST